jgi:hypothetical protein
VSPRLTAKLLLTDEGERGAEPFVLDYRTLVDLSDLVESAIGKPVSMFTTTARRGHTRVRVSR